MTVIFGEPCDWKSGVSGERHAIAFHSLLEYEPEHFSASISIVTWHPEGNSSKFPVVAA